MKTKKAERYMFPALTGNEGALQAARMKNTVEPSGMFGHDLQERKILRTSDSLAFRPSPCGLPDLCFPVFYNPELRVLQRAAACPLLRTIKPGVKGPQQILHTLSPDGEVLQRLFLNFDALPHDCPKVS